MVLFHPEISFFIRKLSDYKEIRTVIKNIDDPDLLQKRSFAHPIFKEMQLAQWIEFIGYHERRHIKQIEEILSKGD
ncbi:DinB family protein [Pseudalkalibacillus decolorationis]|uniref:DinB family protein n=1 Tax=Pseudalkalibacillus decolorationis TaxID=163879 RepID=UPI0021496606|nr:DinB family protein [Pseudalkalibacillus decolorationis]